MQKSHNPFANMWRGFEKEEFKIRNINSFLIELFSLFIFRLPQGGWNILKSYGSRY